LNKEQLNRQAENTLLQMEKRMIKLTKSKKKKKKDKTNASAIFMEWREVFQQHNESVELLWVPNFYQ
jgi:hypothetical protein